MTAESCGSCAATQNPHAVGCPGVPIFCPLCERDIGPVWPSVTRPRLPKVVHRPDGTHKFEWALSEQENP